MSSSSPKLDFALKALKSAGRDIGASGVKDGVAYVSIDGVPRTFDEIFEMAAEQRRGKDFMRPDAASKPSSLDDEDI